MSCRESELALRGLLKDVSRSFYLTLRVLPAAVRPQIGLAYLFARAADTIADTEIVPATDRLDALQEFRRRLFEVDPGSIPLQQFVALQGLPGERLLLERIAELFLALDQLDAADQRLLREVLATITSGQELDLHRFAYASASCVVPLKTDEELDDYTFRVAGCVGEFWTRICRAHLFPSAPLHEGELLANGVRFGKGLQLINILRDLPADLRRGRCYLPLEKLALSGLVPLDLLSPENEARLRPVYDEYLTRAEAHLAAGWNYTNALPRGLMRVRLACAWPILIGARTLARLRTERILDPAQPIKIRRKEVRSLMIRSLAAYPFPRIWQGLFKAGRI